MLRIYFSTGINRAAKISRKLEYGIEPQSAEISARGFVNHLHFIFRKRTPNALMGRILEDITNVSHRNVKVVVKRTNHRRELIRWMYEVVQDFKYLSITFVRAVYIVDKYVQAFGFNKENYQLVGISSLFVSAKLEEHTTMRARDYAAVTDSTFTEDDIIQMEKRIVEMLNYDMYFTLPHSYITQSEINSIEGEMSMRERINVFHASISHVVENMGYCADAFKVFCDARNIVHSVVPNGVAGSVLAYYQRSNDM